MSSCVLLRSVDFLRHARGSGQERSQTRFFLGGARAPRLFHLASPLVLGYGFAPGRLRLSATLLPLESRQGGRTVRSPFSALFLFRVVEASTALASPLKFPGCGGSFSSVAPATLPERGGSYSSIVAGFWSLSSILGFSFFLFDGAPGRFGGRGEEGEESKSSGVDGESADDSPVVVEEEEMLRIAMEGGPTSDSLLGLRVAGFGYWALSPS
ncbi:hypothetical protein IGI04_005949 [Brassica rapa subsp. trilocularis]|uniref:Uncharacterized protein n=1 Tax=Brassica rapa subsp. trilocularis TaxID=1813537 RepID=A0ABQ7NHU2_BRACM|nr:hypothetical protein IGI04_005949 [Brassica rapa subsp. trilocularis]